MTRRLILICCVLVLAVLSGCGTPHVTVSTFQRSSDTVKPNGILHDGGPAETKVYIEEMAPHTAAFNYDKVEFKLTGDLPEGWNISFPMKNQGQIFKQGKQVGSLEIFGYYGDASGSGRPNHSSILSVEGIRSGLGNGKLYILERDMPKDPRTWTEYYAIIPIKGYELAYNVWIDSDDLDNDLLAMKRFLQILGVNNGN